MLNIFIVSLSRVVLVSRYIRTVTAFLVLFWCYYLPTTIFIEFLLFYLFWLFWHFELQNQAGIVLILQSLSHLSILHSTLRHFSDHNGTNFSHLFWLSYCIIKSIICVYCFGPLFSSSLHRREHCSAPYNTSPKSHRKTSHLSREWDFGCNSWGTVCWHSRGRTS